MLNIVIQRLKFYSQQVKNFVNEYIQSLSNHTIDEFNYKYRHIDILLIDDIQFMATKEHLVKYSLIFLTVLLVIKTNCHYIR